MGVKGWKHSEESYRKITENRQTARGEQSGQAVLNDQLVLQIVSLSKFYSHRKLAHLFCVSKGAVTAILNGWTWGHVTGIEGKRKQVRQKVSV